MYDVSEEGRKEKTLLFVALTIKIRATKYLLPPINPQNHLVAL